MVSLKTDPFLKAFQGFNLHQSLIRLKDNINSLSWAKVGFNAEAFYIMNVKIFIQNTNERPP